MGDPELGNVEELKIKGIIGFDGNTNNGLIIHPNGKHIVYPLGNKVTIQDWTTKKQDFLVGHTNIISSIGVSPSGKYVASGQINHIGFKARVIIWDFETKKELYQHEIHKVRVESIAFSKDEHYLISLGGRDCGQAVIWDLHASAVICGAGVSRGAQGDARVVLPMARRGACFATAGDRHLAIWSINEVARAANSIDVSTRKLKRDVLCMDANERDEIMYAGTTTGDILKVRLNFHHDAEILEPIKQPVVIGCFARISRKKLPRGQVDLYGQGVRSIRRLFGGQLIIGAGDGTLEMVEEAPAKIPTDLDVKLPSIPALRVLKSTNVNNAVTSIQLKDQDTIFAGTVSSEIYQVDLNEFKARLIVTCHTSTIYDVAFPHNFSEVFATGSRNNVRVWSMSTKEELLRIRVLNFACSSIVFSYDGSSIFTAWDDGTIRSFTPLTGRAAFTILDAHNKGASALAISQDGTTLVSGGCEGQVRLWEILPYRQSLICTLKEHKGPVSAININKFNTEAASASTDGTCIIWDLERQCRRQILFANTLFMCLKYYPTGVQLITGGSDRKLAYWEVLDGSLVRELEGSSTGTINTLDISPDGQYIVTGGNDEIVKLWRYQEGITTHIGMGHAAVITAAKFSPDGRHIVTANASGGIFIYDSPHTEKKPTEEKEQTPKETPLEQNQQQEENIKDLPTARSGETLKTEKNDEDACCRCPSSRSSKNDGSCRSACDELGDGDGSTSCRSPGSRQSEKSKKSSGSNNNSGGGKKQEERKGRDSSGSCKSGGASLKSAESLSLSKHRVSKSMNLLEEREEKDKKSERGSVDNKKSSIDVKRDDSKNKAGSSRSSKR